MADGSNLEPQAPKKQRRGPAKSQEPWVITPYVVKIEEGFSLLDKGFHELMEEQRGEHRMCTGCSQQGNIGI